MRERRGEEGGKNGDRERERKRMRQKYLFLQHAPAVYPRSIYRGVRRASTSKPETGVGGE